MTQQLPHLMILPTIKAWRSPDNDRLIVLTGKFLTGMEVYAQLWPGRITLCIEEAAAADSNLDHQAVDPADLPYEVERVDYDEAQMVERLREADVVLGSVCWRQNHISRLCLEAGVPCVYVSEYSYQTRCQMERARVVNKLVYARRVLWHYQHERKHRKAIALADGIQCNGTPTFEDYRSLTKNSLLYFDSRVSAENQATMSQIQTRYETLETGRPLRLAFSGRLIAIKGADHLPAIARELKVLEVPFEMTICGEGDLVPAMKKQIADWGLEDQVKMAGVLDFQTELVPFVTEQVDVFVCPHRQGDPSCTYLETMSCGVPMVGYDNAAFGGVVDESDGGWLCPMDQPKAVALQIQKLHQDPSQIQTSAFNALRFAQKHSFNETFERRINHLLEIAKMGEGVSSQNKSEPTTRVLLLAGGLGTRLKPLTDKMPKCLIPIAGRPMLDYWFDRFEAADLSEVRINNHHLPNQVRAYMDQKNAAGKFQITEAYEPTLRGSAGTVTANRDFINDEDLCVLVYADNLSDVDLTGLLEYHRSHDDPFTMMLFHTTAATQCGIATLDDENRVVEFVEKPKHPTSDLANGGIYVLDGKAYREIADMGVFDLGFDVLPKFVGRMRGWVWQGYHRDIGTLESLTQARKDVAEVFVS